MGYKTNRKTKRKFWSTAARKFVDDKTNYLIENENMSPQQAYAVAINFARKQGYKIPKRK